MVVCRFVSFNVDIYSRDADRNLPDTRSFTQVVVYGLSAIALSFVAMLE